MFGLGPATRVYLAVGATDLRKGFEGLFGLVKDRLELEPLSGHVVFYSGTEPGYGDAPFPPVVLFDENREFSLEDLRRITAERPRGVSICIRYPEGPEKRGEYLFHFVWMC